MPKSLYPTAAALLLMASAAPAQTVLSGNHSVDGNLCAGPDCTDSESFPGSADIKLKSFDTRILFEDSSTASGAPTVDWELRANDAGSGFDYFSIRNADTGTQIFRLDDGAPGSSLYVDDDGNVGLGTSLPQADLHVLGGGSVPALSLEEFGATPGTWSFYGGPFLQIGNIVPGTPNAFPVAIDPSAVTNSLYLGNGEVVLNQNGNDNDFRVESDLNANGFFVDGSSGNIGMGTNAPEEILHIQTNTPNTDAFALFDANAAGSDAAFRLRQNGTIPSIWEFRNQQSSGRLNVGLAGGNTPFKIDNAANNNLLRLGRNGLPDEVNITGTLVVNNTALNVPDYVFSDDYALRPLSEVQAFIVENRHLPGVPSAADVTAQGLDMTAMQMAQLEKIEELMLYTLDQQEIILAQRAEMAGLRVRLGAIEAALR